MTEEFRYQIINKFKLTVVSWSKLFYDTNFSKIMQHAKPHVFGLWEIIRKLLYLMFGFTCYKEVRWATI